MKFSQAIVIGNKKISLTSSTFIIAEAGVNHNGNLDIAKKLIDGAKDAKADAVKFQAFRTSSLILKGVKKAPYQVKTTPIQESQFSMLQKLELTKEQYLELQDYCKKRKILFLITPFDETSLEELESLHLPAYKISSTDATNIAFLKKIAQKQKPILLSTGMTYLHELKTVLKEIQVLNPNIILLQCTSNYPIRNEEAHLKVIQTYQQTFGIITGYSDHSEGMGAAPYAVALGAKVIEKHLTLDKNLKGPDHRASLNPQEFKQMVEEIRKVEMYLGSKEKYPTSSELKNRKFLQKYFVSTTDIKKGTLFSEKNVALKRTGGKGICAFYYSKVIGKSSKRDYKSNECVEM